MFFQNRPAANFEYRGNWNNTTAYVAGDAVRSPISRMLYVATGSVTGGNDPGSVGGPASPWASPFAGVLAEGPQGQRGNDGEDGSSVVAYFQESATRPAVGGETYIGGTFTPPTGFAETVPDNPTNPIWMVTFLLDGDGTTYRQLTLFDITGIQGPSGSDGRDGVDGQDGQRGLTGDRGSDGQNGDGISIIYRKSLNYEITQRPSVTFDGTNFTLPTEDNNAWQLSPYVSRVQGNWPLAGSGNNAPDHANIDPASIDIDTTVQPNVVYVLDSNNHGDTNVGGYVYRYRNDAYIDRWPLAQANDTPIDIDVQGSVVRVLDGRTRGSQRVYVYNKEDGGRRDTQEFMVPNTSASVAQTITTQGSSIYLTSVDEIRRFNLSDNVEQSTGTLSGLTINPIGTDADERYFFIVDSNTNTVYARDINTLSLRHTIREWTVTSASPNGIAVGEFEVLILNSSTNQVYRYYNPSNILWASVLSYDNNAPFPNTVATTVPLDMTGRDGVGGTTVIQGSGVGTNGDSVRFIFREIATGGATPATPMTSEGTYSNGNYSTPPTGWHLTAAEAIADFSGDGDLYVSVVRLSGNGNTILSYDQPVDISGEQGPAGDSVEFEFSADNNRWDTTAQATDKYIRFRTGSTGPWSAGVKFVGDDGAAGSPGDSISLEYSEDGNAPWSSTLTNNHYYIRIQIGTAGWSNAIRFRAYPLLIQYSADGNTPWSATFTTGTSKYIRFSSDNGASWSAGARFVGEDGNDGDDSLQVQYSNDNSSWHANLLATDLYIRFRVGTNAWSDGRRFVGVTGGFQATLYQRSANQPTAPTNVTYNPTTLGNPYGGTIGSWVPDIPTGTDQIWRVNITVPPALSPGNLPVTVNGGVYSERGAMGTAGADGRFYDWVFQWAPTRPADPTPTTFDGSRIHGISPWLQAPAATGSPGEFLWAAEIEIRGSTTIYINTVRLSGPAGQDGADSTVAGPSGASGNSVTVIYRRSATDPGNPTGGTWNGRDYDPPTNWHESDPDPNGTNPLYMTVVHLSGTDSTNTGIRYDSAVRITGRDGRDGQDAPGIGDHVEAVRFGITGDTTDQTLTSVSPDGSTERNRVYRDITAFTGGTTGLATQDSTGITIPNAGVYSIDLVIDIRVIASAGNRYPDSEWGIIIHIEDADGNVIEDKPAQTFINDGFIDASFTAPIGYGLVPRSIPAGAKIYLRLFYQTIAPGSSTGDQGQAFTYRVMNAADMSDRLTIRRYTTAGGSGSTGNDGNSLDVVYRRSDQTLRTPPTGGSAREGALVSAPTGWSTTVPGGTDPLYIAFAHISSVTPSIRYSEPVRSTGQPGESVTFFYQRTATNTNPGQPAITYNGLAFGGFGDWVPTTQGSDPYLWAVIVNYRMGVNGSQSVGNPFLMSSPGADGQDGTNAPQVQFQYSVDGNTPWGAYASNSAFFRTSVDGGNSWSAARRFRGLDGTNGTNGNNAPQVQFQYSDTGRTPWSATDGPNSAYFRVSVDGGTVWSNAIRFRGVDGTNGTNGNDGTDGTNGTDGVNGFGYINYYHANTADSVGVPNVDYDGTNFSNITSGWTTTIPTTPAGANVFVAPVRYQIGTSGETIDGVVRLGIVPGTIAPPNRNSYTMNYGLATGSPGYSISNTKAAPVIQLASGETGYFDFTTDPTTASHRNVYFDLPTGLTLVNVQQRQGGAYLTNPTGWTTQDSTQPRRYFYSGNRLGAHTIVRVNVRRP